MSMAAAPVVAMAAAADAWRLAGQPEVEHNTLREEGQQEEEGSLSGCRSKMKGGSSTREGPIGAVAI